MNKREKSKVNDVINTNPNTENVVSDVDGSYTGRPIDGGKPCQDADDL